jgi:soluble lytic murein transglycosylase
MRRKQILTVVGLALLFSIPLAALLFSTGYWLRERQREREFEKEITRAAEKYRVDPLLVKAVIWQESKFNKNAKGRAGEIGLMQIMPMTAEEWGEAQRIENFSPTHIWEPSQNIEAGAWYLAKCLKRYTKTDNPVPYALADYNAGRTHVLRWNKGEAATNSTAFLARMDYPGTRKYAQSVMERYEYYRKKAKRS